VIGAACRGSAQRERHAVARGGLQHLHAHLAQRLEHAAHGAAGQRGVADEGGLHVVGADEAHGEARAGAGIAEVERLPRAAGAQPLPVPLMIHSAPCFSMRAPIAFIASPVRMTSSPSSRPVMRVSPEARPPNMKERCEIDLSPGTRAVPLRDFGASGRWPDCGSA
jgi:hypothetical protein